MFLYSSAESLLEANRQFHLLFWDIDMGNLNGIETTRKLRSYDKQVKIVYLRGYMEFIGVARLPVSHISYLSTAAV